MVPLGPAAPAVRREASRTKDSSRAVNGFFMSVLLAVHGKFVLFILRGPTVFVNGKGSLTEARPS